MTEDQKIENLRLWASDNYENGADTFVECWGTSDYRRSLADHGGNYRQTLATLKRVAAVYRERQADARNSAW